MSTPDEVLDYWLGEPARDADAFRKKLQRWYQGGPEVDREIVARFTGDVERALRGELDDWAETPRGRLALVILLDQFTRNVYRNDPRTFSGDAKAQALASEAFARGLDAGLTLEERQFLHMPLLHAEDNAMQTLGLREARRLVADAPEALKGLLGMGVEQAEKYSGIIQRFGRFPHRNAVLGRQSTPEEVEFLKDWEARRAPAQMAEKKG